MTKNYTKDLRDCLDRNVVDPDGDKIGTVSGVYVDDETGEPSWLAVTTGWFGTNISFVPIEGAYIGGDDVVVAYQKDIAKNAPNFDADGHLNRDEEYGLYEYYGLSGRYGRGAGVPGRVDDDDRTRDDAMTRSEEELEVSKQRTETGRVRLRKWIETENVSMTVPIRREKARLVAEPITERNIDKALSGSDLQESEHEVTLSKEEVDVTKRVVPKERVRLEKEVDTEEVPIDETIRKERIQMDQDQVR